MCFDATTSIITFSISILSSIYLFKMEKNNKNNKFFSIVLVLIGLMQLLEYFLWKNQKCEIINHYLSLLIIVLITLQPILGINYYIYLFNKTIFNKNFVFIYCILYILLSLYILNKLNSKKLCSKPTSKSCRLNWDAFDKLAKNFPRYFGLSFFILYFTPQLLILYDLIINHTSDIYNYPIRHTFLPLTFLSTLFYVCYKQNIFKKFIFDPTIYLHYTDVWGSMWCFMSAFLGLVGILKY